MRKTVKFFLKLLCILAFSILVSSKDVDAANVQTLKADTWYEFSLYEDQKDYFTFYAPANKYFRVELIRTSCSMGNVIKINRYQYHPISNFSNIVQEQDDFYCILNFWTNTNRQMFSSVKKSSIIIFGVKLLCRENLLLSWG